MYAGTRKYNTSVVAYGAKTSHVGIVKPGDNNPRYNHSALGDLPLVPV